MKPICFYTGTCSTTSLSKRGHFYAGPARQKTGAPRFYALFHVLRGRKPDLSAPPWCASRGKPLARLCGVRRQRHRSAHHGRCRRGQRGRAGPAGQPGPPEVCPRLCDFGLSLHRALPRHPPHGQHFVRDAGAATGRRARAAARVFRRLLRGGLPRGAPARKAHRPAGPCPLPGPHRPDFDSFRGRSAPPGRRTVRHPCRRLRSVARLGGHPWRLSDHGHPRRAQLRGRHRAEHSGAGHH